MPYWFIQDFVLQICPLLETISRHAACFPSSDKCWYLSFFIMMLSQIRHSCQSKFNNLRCNFMFRQIHDLPGDQPYPFHLCHAIRGGSSGAPENISKTWQISLSKSFLSNEKINTSVKRCSMACISSRRLCPASMLSLGISSEMH